MKRRNLGIDREPTIMIIPMIDIVFFLLVFFMVSSLYMNTEQQIPLSLPKASTVTAKNIEPVSITIKSDGQLYIDKVPVANDQALAERIQQFVNANSSQAFVVRADKNVVYDKVIHVLDELKLNGAKYVSVATDRK